MNGFLRVGKASDIPLLEGRSAWLGMRRVAIFRTESGFFALSGVCPHAGGPLADGIVADSCVTCPLHNRRFDLRSGAPLGDYEGVERYDVTELDGELWVRIPRSADRAA